MMLSVMAVIALWATVAIAGVNEDLIKAAESGDLTNVKSLIASGARHRTLKRRFSINKVDLPLFLVF